jgi:hypothetical protein
MYRPATSALLTDLTPPGERIPAFPLNRLAINAGFPAGPATAGFLAEESFFFVFLGDALTSAVSAWSRPSRCPRASASAAARNGEARP